MRRDELARQDDELFAELTGKVMAAALQALLEKHQPEGGYDPIDPTVPQYAKALAHVGVYRMRCESWTGKVKFGQNEPDKLQQIFVTKLRERGGPTDEATACEIEKNLAE